VLQSLHACNFRFVYMIFCAYLLFLFGEGIVIKTYHYLRSTICEVAVLLIIRELLLTMFLIKPM